MEHILYLMTVEYKREEIWRFWLGCHAWRWFVNQTDNSCFGQIPETPQHRLPGKEESKTQWSPKANNQSQNLREKDSDTDESEEDEVVTCDEYDEEEDILAEIGSVENERRRIWRTRRGWWNPVPRRSWNHNERNHKIRKKRNSFSSLLVQGQCHTIRAMLH